MSDGLLEKAQAGITAFLDEKESNLKSDHPNGLPKSAIEYFDKARANVIPNLKEWMEDPYIGNFSANIVEGITEAIQEEKWAEIVDVFLQDISFGTAGIRGRMAFDKESILKLKKDGLTAKILKGPATINDKVLLLKSVGVAKFALDRGMNKIVIGYDSRICGQTFAQLISRLFLAYELTIYLFDEACPYPELTFAVPNLRADIGILISASHNDYRYNGYKVSCGNGSQFSLEDRATIVRDYISSATSADIKLIKFEDAGKDQLWFLGGAKPVEGLNYFGREDHLIDMHTRHIEHVKKFVIRKDIIESQKDNKKPLNIGFCAYHGAGRIAVPRLLQESGFSNILPIQRLNELDGMFPCFNSEPGHEQQPDPGDTRAAAIAVQAFQEEYPGVFDNLDILIGTDPDADRCGLIVKVPEQQQELHDGRTYTLLPADDLWALILWYRLQQEVEQYGSVQNPEIRFISMSHTTSDALIKLAKKYGIGVTKSWVGFAMLAMCVNEAWQNDSLPDINEGRLAPNNPKCHPFMHSWVDMNNGQRKYNLAAMEQSSGFSILGGPPPDAVSMGDDGHVRDKDGTLAALLLAEIASYAKQKGTTLYSLIDENVFLDPEIGYFLNYYEPDPLDGEYDGMEGYIKKREVIQGILDLKEECDKGSISLAGVPVTSTAIYWTGKYDKANFDGFPDEGVRFYFDEEKWNYLTFRPSGTSNALRFHLQLHQANVTKETLTETKKNLKEKAKELVAELRRRVGAV